MGFFPEGHILDERVQEYRFGSRMEKAGETCPAQMRMFHKAYPTGSTFLYSANEPGPSGSLGRETKGSRSMELATSALGGSKLECAVCCAGPVAVKLHMRLWGRKYECVAIGRRVCSLLRLCGLCPTKKPGPR